MSESEKETIATYKLLYMIPIRNLIRKAMNYYMKVWKVP